MRFKRKSLRCCPNLREIIATTLRVRRRIPESEHAALAERLAWEFAPLANAGRHGEVIDGLSAAIIAAELGYGAVQ